MKKSTRALTGMVVMDGLLATGAAWMVFQVRSGSGAPPTRGLRSQFQYLSLQSAWSCQS